LDLLRLALTAGVDVAVSLADKPHDEFLSPFFECLDETFQVRRGVEKGSEVILFLVLELVREKACRVISRV
jgi:hypothetical protein